MRLTTHGHVRHHGKRILDQYGKLHGLILNLDRSSRHVLLIEQLQSGKRLLGVHLKALLQIRKKVRVQRKRHLEELAKLVGATIIVITG